jgi:GAF domain-containing protein
MQDVVQMLRTQQAQTDQTRHDGIEGLCEAICLDAVEVASATRAGIWLFDDDGAMICQRQFDSREGHFRQGLVIPRAQAEVYIKAASAGLAAATTDTAPELDRSAPGDKSLQTRLDLLLVDSRNQPTAMLCCERAEQNGDWRDRDVYVLRNLAQALAGAIRRYGEAPGAATQGRSEIDVDLDPDLDAIFNACNPEEGGWRH